MLASSVVFVVSQNWYQAAMAAHRQNLVLRSTLLGAFTNLILCALLVRPYGAAGAALSTLAAEVAVAVALYVPLWQEHRAGLFREILAPLCACVVSMAGAWILAQPWPLVSSALCGGIYVSCLVLMKAFSAADLREALSLLKRESGSADSDCPSVESISNVGA